MVASGATSADGSSAGVGAFSVASSASRTAKYSRLRATSALSRDERAAASSSESSSVATAVAAPGPRDGSGGAGVATPRRFFADPPCPSPLIAAAFGARRPRVDRLQLRAFRGVVAAAAVTSRVVAIRGAGGEDGSPTALRHPAERPEAARGAHARGSARRADARSARDSSASRRSHARGAPTVAIARRLGLVSPAREASSARKCLGRMPLLAIR